MRKIILLGLLCFLFACAYAQANSDSVAYQLQRKKINAMLAERTQKFGQYDKSLKEHTGIFGERLALLFPQAPCRTHLRSIG